MTNPQTTEGERYSDAELQELHVKYDRIYEASLLPTDSDDDEAEEQLEVLCQQMKEIWQRQYCAEFARFAGALGWDEEAIDHVLWKQENPLADAAWLNECGDPAPAAHTDVALCELHGVLWTIEEAASRLNVANPTAAPGWEFP